MTSFHARQAGKYTLMKEDIGNWCMTAKVGHSVLVATLDGVYKLKFCGKFKPSDGNAIKVVEGGAK